MARYGVGYGRFNYNRSRSYANSLIRRQGGTGAAYSGAQNIIRHANSSTGTIETGDTKALPLVIYNPDNAGTVMPPSGGVSSSWRASNYCDKGSRVDYVTVQLTLRQTDTSKNNTCYVGTISTSFNEGRLSADLMKANFGNNVDSFIEDEGDGKMDVNASALGYTLNSYSLNDIQQHNIRNLLSPQFQLYSGRVVTANQTIPLPRKNRRQQEGSLYAMVIMNDSDPDGSDIEYRLDTFFKEIPANAV